MESRTKPPVQYSIVGRILYYVQYTTGRKPVLNPQYSTYGDLYKAQ
ncbi:unnamed protein product [Ectocarpus sp. CCAP 1310/34]|nr:unnamed protein product [Ectocarpus sp. CCAP 1310/34]